MEGEQPQWPVYIKNSQFNKPLLFPVTLAIDFDLSSASFDAKTYLLTNLVTDPIRWHLHHGL